MQKRYKSLTDPYHQAGEEHVFLSYGINGSLRKREVTQPQQHTEYYLFNSQGNLKAYSDDVMSLTYYSYDAANTRTYKLSMYNLNQWVNGQPQPLQLQLQNAMFYPNAYLTFNQNGEYTKHYYNGSERICSRLGDNVKLIAATGNGRLAYRTELADWLFRSELQELVSIYGYNAGTPATGVNVLISTGSPNDIFYYHTNHLGSTAFVTDGNATVTQGFLYAPFGEIISEYQGIAPNSALPQYTFNAKELDEETGMYYYEARYYQPPVFVSRDPMFEQKPWLTPYHYCSNNPVGRVDPTGQTDYDVETKNGTERKTIDDGHDGIRVEVSQREYNKLERKYNRNSNSYEKYRKKLKDNNGYYTFPSKCTINFHMPKKQNAKIGIGGSVDVAIAVGLGYTIEFGYIRDSERKGNWFLSHGIDVGYEASISANLIIIPKTDFKNENFGGRSASLNISTPYVSGAVISDYSEGAERDYYFNNYGGFKFGEGFGVGASLSITKTKFLK